MSFSLLALIGAVAIIGPLLATPSKWRVPVVIGELIAGLLIGNSGLKLIDPDQATLTFMADVGFALVMFIAGSHVPLRNDALKRALNRGVVRQLAVVVVAAALGVLVATLFGTGHAALYAVLMASSSAALIMPIVDGTADQPDVLTMMAQVAIADVLAFVALPLALDPASAPRALLGTAAVLAAAVVIFLLLRAGERNGVRQRIHRLSGKHRFALELRIQLVVLFALAGLAVSQHVSIMLAGFALGLAVAAVGEPERLAAQLFGMTEGFFAPLFFVWLGASLSLSQLFGNPLMTLLGLALGVGALLAHAATRILGQSLPLGVLSAAQLGVPVAAATVGLQEKILQPGEASALILGALITVAAAGIAGSRHKSYQITTKVAAN